MIFAARYPYDSFGGYVARVEMTLRRDVSQTDLAAVVFTANKHFTRV